MDTVTLDRVMKSPERVIESIREGKIFIYPTDTVYGLGCNALLGDRVLKIRQIKSSDKPFSVIAPSKNWIREHTEARGLERLPGPYTLILKKKDPSFLKEASATDKLGIRIPDHQFWNLVSKAGVPFITTSANQSEKPMNSTPTPLDGVDIVIDAGPLGTTASRVLDMTGQEPAVLR
jgi:tRNA threonylcarbamoyl adenosine modification protein (Sua5/YciO/YrdC/YwlC family)